MQLKDDGLHLSRDWPVEVDAIRLAALPLIEHIFAVTR